MSIWDKAANEGRKARRGWLGTAEDVGRSAGRLKLVFYCSARDETGGLDLGEQRKGRCVGSLSGFLTGMAYVQNKPSYDMISIGS